MHQLIKDFLRAKLNSDLKIKQARLAKVKELHVHKEEFDYATAEIIEIERQLNELKEEIQNDKLN